MNSPKWLKKTLLVVVGAVIGALVSIKILRAKRRPIVITRRVVENYYRSLNA